VSKQRLLIAYGGRSAEHEVSVRSAKEVLAAVDRDLFEPILLALPREGGFRTGPVDRDLGEIVSSGEVVADIAALRPDVVFPILHGPNGEDGSFQGLLETLNLPYVGSPVRASALCMDKAVLKRLLSTWGVPQVPWLELRAHEYEAQGIDALTQRVAVTLDFPCFVKPANMGSSVGVHHVRKDEELGAALEDAFRYDDKVVIEQAVKPREVELAVLGNGGPETRVSVAGEIVVPEGKFYDYDTKYVTDDAKLVIPAELDPVILLELQRIALLVFRAVECRGLCRMDFLIDQRDSAIYFNEPNTLPGFTTISMYPKLIEALGVGYSALITELCALAQAEFKRKQRLET
jgi:D-alanine-D-alanine ligase